MSKPKLPLAQVPLPGTSSAQPVAVVRAPDAPPDAPPVLVALPAERRKPGRPRGSRNAASIARDKALAAAMGQVEFAEVADSIALLRAVMKSPAVPLQERLRCALALAPFDAPKIATAPAQREVDVTLAQRLEEAFRRTGRGGAPAAPAGLTPEQQAELQAMLS